LNSAIIPQHYEDSHINANLTRKR